MKRCPILSTGFEKKRSIEENTGHPGGRGNHLEGRLQTGALPMTTSPTLSSQQDPDADLVRRCQAGGPDAPLCFERLIARHAVSIKRRATRILGDESEAEDVVQDVFLNVHRFLHR